MTQKEKAKAYDEAIERARDFMNGEVHYALKKGENIVCWLFPELRESEDERIRKELLDFCKNRAENYPNDPKYKNISAWIAWLEKQGEQKPVDVRTTGYWHVEDASEGRWFGNGIKAHLWTIQDAKDGDVLIDKSGSRECPFIFKEIKPSDIKTDMPNPLAVLGYCGIGGAGFTKGSGWGDTANCIYYPATKEQREQLEKAMADAGYTFDFEKKELKKVEQTSADETPYPETLEKAIDLYYYSYGNGEGEFERLSLEKFRDIVHTFVSDYGQKPAWSEEDKYLCTQIEGFLQECWIKNLVHFGLYKKMRNFLNSLRNRVQPQLDQEWSEEDEKHLNRAINILDASKVYTKSPDKYEDTINWLKSLKDRVQPKQEWSEDTQQWIDAIIFDYESWYDADKDHRTTIQAKINILKSLKERYTWKPSDEQMEALWSATEKYLESDNENVRKLRGEVLESLYNDLKKLK